MTGIPTAKYRLLFTAITRKIRERSKTSVTVDTLSGMSVNKSLASPGGASPVGGISLPQSEGSFSPGGASLLLRGTPLPHGPFSPGICPTERLLSPPENSFPSSGDNLRLVLYWEIGCLIHAQSIPNDRIGTITTVLSNDLRKVFKNIKSFSARNLRYMCAFASAYPGNSRHMLQEGFWRLSWSHHTILLDLITDDQVRLFYIHRTVAGGWSRMVMEQQIRTGLHLREGRLSANFFITLDTEQSGPVQQIFKDPYTFGFVQLDKMARERDIETALTRQMKAFLIELGQGFAYVGRQHKVQLGSKEYFIDLLFYHIRLKRYIVIDVKTGAFKPEHLGKMSAYLTLADDYIRGVQDEKSIGLLLCRYKNNLEADYFLRQCSKPIGIATYTIKGWL